MLVTIGASIIIAAMAGLIGFSVVVGALFAGLVFSRDPLAVNVDAAFNALKKDSPRFLVIPVNGSFSFHAGAKVALKPIPFCPFLCLPALQCRRRSHYMDDAVGEQITGVLDRTSAKDVGVSTASFIRRTLEVARFASKVPRLR